jgi:hypothetical protein
MRPAFPTSDYYGPSAPPRRHQPTASLPTRAAHQQRRDGRHRDGSHVHHASIDGIGAQLFPCSIATSTPQTFLAASPPTALDRLRSPRPANVAGRRALRSGPHPPGWSRRPLLRGFNHWFTLVTPFRLAERALNRLVVPVRLAVVRAAPALACASRLRLPSASPGRCDDSAAKPSQLRSIT